MLDVAINTKSLPKAVYNDWFTNPEWTPYVKTILEHILQQFEWRDDKVDGDFTERRKHISINKD